MINPTNATAGSVTAPKIRACPRCGLTETLLCTEGLLGCSTCYETFADLVAQAVVTLHRVTISPSSAPVDVAPEVTPPPPAVPVRRKRLSWLPQRTPEALPPAVTKKKRPSR